MTCKQFELNKKEKPKSNKPTAEFTCNYRTIKNQNKPSYWLTIEQLKIKTSHLIGSNRPMRK